MYCLQNRPNLLFFLWDQTMQIHTPPEHPKDSLHCLRWDNPSSEYRKVSKRNIRVLRFTWCLVLRLSLRRSWKQVAPHHEGIHLNRMAQQICPQYLSPLYLQAEARTWGHLRIKMHVIVVIGNKYFQSYLKHFETTYILHVLVPTVYAESPASAGRWLVSDWFVMKSSQLSNRSYSDSVDQSRLTPEWLGFGCIAVPCFRHGGAR